MEVLHINTPFSPEVISSLNPGDKVLISGIIYTARDAAHKRMLEYLDNGTSLPIDLKSSVIFYCGPSPTPLNRLCGSIGPTTSYRMDFATPRLIKEGLRVMIGKGERSLQVKKSIHENGAVYLQSMGGIAALLSKSVVSCETFAWEDLGTEAIFKLVVNDFPAFVAYI